MTSPVGELARKRTISTATPDNQKRPRGAEEEKVVVVPPLPAKDLYAFT
ncbi:hypothetical protein BRCON_2194 [Candidatus Sumerlaea chitinivorans]|uniref:Uncharacterized protein n=1 Tax=Sumerlaea chitinivorans TaxID=2250252 RepID=A0A2Z4Y709_SUMC1|nr:hypothetical protein BRCON_2194 [Candidatus Sumerlaea chitinivorans]